MPAFDKLFNICRLQNDTEKEAVTSLIVSPTTSESNYIYLHPWDTFYGRDGNKQNNMRF